METQKINQEQEKQEFEVCPRCKEPITNKEFVMVEDVFPPVESKFKIHHSCFREMWGKD